jgi:hypothetical protein
MLEMNAKEIAQVFGGGPRVFRPGPPPDVEIGDPIIFRLPPTPPVVEQLAVFSGQ